MLEGIQNLIWRKITILPQRTGTRIFPVSEVANKWQNNHTKAFPETRKGLMH